MAIRQSHSHGGFTPLLLNARDEKTARRDHRRTVPLSTEFSKRQVAEARRRF
jgi:hypothetical protein